MSDVYAELAELGVANVFEASGRRGLIDADLERIVPGTRAAGPARTVRCGDGDNLMVHAAMEHAQAGEVLVMTMPAPKPVTLMGETSSRHRRKPGCRGGARRCCRSRRRRAARARAPGLGAIHPRARGPDKNVVGELDQPVEVGGVTIRPRDVVVLDADGAVVVER